MQEISGASVLSLLDPADSAQIVKFSASNARRFVRAAATIGGTTPSFIGKKQIVP